MAARVDQTGFTFYAEKSVVRIGLATATFYLLDTDLVHDPRIVEHRAMESLESDQTEWTFDGLGEGVLVQSPIPRAIWEPPITLGVFSNEEAKDMIRSLLEKTPSLDQMEISQSLALDFDLTCELCEELLRERKIRRLPSDE